MTTVVYCLCMAVAALLIVASFLPLIGTEWWLVRLLDFPRLQFLIVLIAVGFALLFFIPRSPWTTLAMLAGIVSACLSHTVILWPYRPSGERFVDNYPADGRLSVMVANVQLGNRNAGALVEMVQGHKPDLFLAMETDTWWDRALRPIAATMPNTIQKITGSYYGIHLFSRLPLVHPEIRFLAGQDTPSVVCGVTLGTGETITFVGMHPRPPQLGQSALGRDAELYAAAFLLRDGGEPGILAGDINATPWEIAVDRTRRIAGLIDPRRGFGYVPTFSAKSWWEKWPLDHIFHGRGFTTRSLERLDAFGSDHYPYIARLSRVTGQADKAAPSTEERDLAASGADLSAAEAAISRR